MSVYLREADLDHDQCLLTAFAGKYLEAMDDERFRWLYRDNPCGTARVWLALNDRTQDPVGMAALFPRRCYVGGIEVSGCVLGDFCVSEKYRSLGPALQLQRACMSTVRSGEFAFCYDFPSSAMLGVYKYLDLQPADMSVRMVKFLRVDRKVRQLVQVPSAAGAISKVANLALALGDRKTLSKNGIEYRLDEQSCSAEYHQLAQEIGSSLGDCILRSPVYLNWRYRQHPSQRYEFLAAYRCGKLRAYCVFLTLPDGNVGISDLFGVREEESTDGLLTYLVELLRQRGASEVSISVLAGDPRAGLLKRLGFWSRESVPVIGFAANPSYFGSQLMLMHGDRES
jgi:hypothetical protein